MPLIYKFLGVALVALAIAIAPRSESHMGYAGLACGLSIAGGLCLLGAAILDGKSTR